MYSCTQSTTDLEEQAQEVHDHRLAEQGDEDDTRENVAVKYALKYIVLVVDAARVDLIAYLVLEAAAGTEKGVFVLDILSFGASTVS
jgi:hypothetical protein